MKWTEQQQAVISASGSDLIVAAAAGSGKTTVMVERICRLLLSGEADSRQLAVVTFTRAAAAEMKNRILARLMQEAQGGGHFGRRALAQLKQIDYAAIGTLHSFCGSIIKRHYPVAGIDPAFRTAEDSEAALLRTQAVKDVLEEMFQRADEEFLDFAACWSGRDTAQLEKLVLSAYVYLRGHPDYFSWAQELLKQYFVPEEALRASGWAQELHSSMVLNLQNALALAEYALDYPDVPEKYLACFQSDYAMMKELLDLLSLNKDQEAARFAQELKFPSIPRKAKADDADVVEFCKEIRGQWKKLTEDVITSPMLNDFSVLARNTNLAARHIRALLALEEAFEAAYERAKRLANVLDYDDLEHLALRILQDEDARREIREQYVYLFVDEFQDISPVQDALLERLGTPGRYFCVGDVKQSIYRFRSAAPELFQRKIAQSGLQEGASKRKILLTRNYRSSLQIIDFANMVFASAMSQAVGEVTYDDTQKLVCSRETRPYDEGSVELCIVDMEGRGESELSEMEDLVRLQREALLAARKIREAMGRPIWDEKLQAMRPLSYGDIALLVRQKKNTLPLYMETLRQAGIPAMAGAEQGFAQEMEVAVLADVLKVVDNGMRDQELIRALYSPLGGFTLEELLRIRAAQPETPFYQCAAAYAAGYRDAVAQKMGGFLALLKRWKILARSIDLGELVYGICRDTDFYDVAGALPGGHRRQYNIRRFAEIASAYPGGMLCQFADNVEDILSSEKTVLPEGGEESAVSVMSVHNAKGLEFPVVMLMNMGAGINLQDARGDMLYHRQLGFGPAALEGTRRTRGDTLPKLAVALRNNRETFSEEMRILYVALTRAKEKLYLIGTVGNMAKKRIRWKLPPLPAVLAKEASFLDWVCLSLHAGGVVPDAGQPTYASSQPGVAHKLVYQCLPADEIHAVQERQPGFDQRRARMDELLRKKINCTRAEQVFAWEYPYAQAARLPAKVTATSLLDEHRAQEAMLAAPPIIETPDFMVKEQRFTAMDRGTFVHMMLQMLPADGGADARAFALELEERGLLPEGASEAMQYEWIEGFFRTDIAKRIAASPLVRREEPFNLALPARELYAEQTSDEPVMVQGIIDCCFMEDGRWVLVDYKTNRVDAQHTPAYYLDYYAPQLRIYRRALTEITGTAVKECCLYLVATGDVVSLAD